MLDKPRSMNSLTAQPTGFALIAKQEQALQTVQTARYSSGEKAELTRDPILNGNFRSRRPRMVGSCCFKGYAEFKPYRSTRHDLPLQIHRRSPDRIYPLTESRQKHLGSSQG